MKLLIVFLIVVCQMLFILFIYKLSAASKISLLKRGILSSMAKVEHRESFLDALNNRILQSGTGINLPIYMAIIMVSSFSIYMLADFLTDSKIMAVLMAGLGMYVPNILIEYINKRKKTAFDDAFVKVLKRLSASMKAKMSMLQALEDAAEAMSIKEAMKVEIRQVLSDYAFTANMSKAFYNMYERNGSEIVKSVAMSIEISRKFGSPLDKVFDSFAMAILDRRRAEAEAKSKLASTKTTANIIAATPFVFGGFMKFIQPEYFIPVYEWKQGLGRIVIVAMYAMVSLGFIYIRKKCDVRL